MKECGGHRTTDKGLLKNPSQETQHAVQHLVQVSVSIKALQLGAYASFEDLDSLHLRLMKGQRGVDNTVEAMRSEVRSSEMKVVRG
jgi:hypothetical protein